MTPVIHPVPPAFAIPSNRLSELLAALQAEGFQLVGPKARDGAIVFSEIDGVEDLPRGYSVAQKPGYYRAEPSDGHALFAYAAGPNSLKAFLYPPKLPLFRARKTETGFSVESASNPVPRFAFIGVRPCDLQAVEIQDRVFGQQPFVDADYLQRRRNAFFVAVNCLEPGSTCFCSSMDSGPSAKSGYDLLLTEIVEVNDVTYIAESGTAQGQAILEHLDLEPASPALIGLGDTRRRQAEQKIRRRLETENLAELLKSRLEHPRWDQLEDRCLACGNCTLVCPTCFCSSVHDHTDLTGDIADRSRVWDSCFQTDFSYVAGGPLRPSVKGRYRQWLTHKLSSWKDQFDTFGCVGCGRCIAWCPVGIDITAEAAAIVGDDRGEITSPTEKVSP